MSEWKLIEERALMDLVNRLRVMAGERNPHGADYVKSVEWRAADQLENYRVLLSHPTAPASKAEPDKAADT